MNAIDDDTKAMEHLLRPLVVSGLAGCGGVRYAVRVNVSEYKFSARVFTTEKKCAAAAREDEDALLLPDEREDIVRLLDKPALSMTGWKRVQ